MSLYTHGEGTEPCRWLGKDGCGVLPATHPAYMRPSSVLILKGNRELVGPYTRISNNDLEIINQMYTNCYHNKPKDAQTANWCARAWRTMKEMRCNAGTQADKCACMQALLNDPEVPADVRAPYLAEMRKICPSYVERFPSGDQIPLWFWLCGAIVVYLVATMKR